MARRKQKRRSPRRYKGAVNVVNLAEGVMLANVATKWFFQTDLQTFFSPDPKKGVQSYEITMRELIDLAIGGSGGIKAASYPGGLSQVLQRNARGGAVNGIFQMIAIPAMFSVGTKITAKPRRMVNKGIRKLGMGNVVKV